MKRKETLSQKQRRFTEAIGKLIAYAYLQGYELTFGDAYRDGRIHGMYGTKSVGSYSAPYSVHKQRLAVDFNLFVDGIYIQTSDHPAWRDLHQYWESLGGAESIPNDANHFSFEYQGRR